MSRTSKSNSKISLTSSLAIVLSALLAAGPATSQTTPSRAQDICASFETPVEDLAKSGACAGATVHIPLGGTVNQPLVTGQSRCFKINVEIEKKEQFVQVLVRQNGIDVETTLYDTDGRFMVRRDTTTGARGEEPISFITQKPGKYTIVVSAPGTPGLAQSEPGANGFDIQFAQSRPALTHDALSVVAEWNFHAADVMRVSQDARQLPCAVNKFQKALAAYIKLENVGLEAQTRNNIGYSLNELRRYREAIAYVIPAIGLWPSLRNPFREGEALNNLGFAYEMVGEIDSAIEANGRALEKFKEARLQAREAEDLTDIDRAEIHTLINLSDLYIKIHQPDKAISGLQSHVNLPYISNRPDLAAVLIRDIGRAFEVKGDYNAALGQFKAALEKIPAGDSRFDQIRASLLNAKGVMLIYLGVYREGLANFQEALRLYGDNQYGRAAVYNSLGGAYATKGVKGKRTAIDYFWKALDILDGIKGAERKMEVTQGTADTLYNLALAQRDLGQMGLAKDHLEEAIAYIEFLRTRTGNREIRESIFAGKRFYYEAYIDLLRRLHRKSRKAGYDAEALQASERARGRSLLDLLIKAGVPAPASIPDELVNRVAGAHMRLTDAMREQRRAYRAGPDSARDAAAHAEVRIREREYRALAQELKRTGAASLVQPYSPDVEQIKALLGDNTVLLEYEVGARKSLLWVVNGDTGSPIFSAELPGRQALEKLVRKYLDALTARGCRIKNEYDDERRARIAAADRAYPAAASELGQILLRPALPYLPGKRVVIVASEVLQLLPFGALPVPAARPAGRGGKAKAEILPPPLVAAHEVVYLPSASALAEIRGSAPRRPPATKLIAALANPVVDPADERILNRAGAAPVPRTTAAGATRQLLRGPKCVPAEEFPSLPGSHNEVLRIFNLLQGEGNKRAFEGFEASLATLGGGSLRDYKVIHIASHASVPPGSPESASIVLSLFNERGEPVRGHLWLSDIPQLDINADLVTLSACETGIGRDVIGEGVVGLSRGFMYAGTPRVVASLWKVDDAATAALMADFYSAIFNRGMSPSAALQEAQKNMRQKPERAEWALPFYWAAFTLQGDWHGLSQIGVSHE